jgi:hypothetical protein
MLASRLEELKKSRVIEGYFGEEDVWSYFGPLSNDAAWRKNISRLSDFLDSGCPILISPPFGEIGWGF